MKLTFIVIDKFGRAKETLMRDFDISLIYKKCSFKNDKNFNKEITWKFSDYQICLFAKNDGRAMNENKFELPPPVDKKLYFGNMAIIKLNFDNDPLDISLNEWNEIYNTLMGGFEDIQDTDDEQEEDELSEYPNEMLTNDGYLKDGFVIDDKELENENYETE